MQGCGITCFRYSLIKGARMSSKCLAALGLAGLISGTPYALAQSAVAPSLGEAASFAVLAGAGVRSSGTTVITGNAGKSVDGSPIIKLGSVRNDLVSRALKDAGIAYDRLTALSCIE